MCFSIYKIFKEENHGSRRQQTEESSALMNISNWRLNETAIRNNGKFWKRHLLKTWVMSWKEESGQRFHMMLGLQGRPRKKDPIGLGNMKWINNADQIVFWWCSMKNSLCKKIRCEMEVKWVKLLMLLKVWFYIKIEKYGRKPKHKEYFLFGLNCTCFLGQKSLSFIIFMGFSNFSWLQLLGKFINF